MYSFASGGFGVSAARRYYDKNTHRTVVLGIDLILDDLDAIVKAFDLPTDTAAMFIAEVDGDRDSPMPLVATTVGATFLVSVGPAGVCSAVLHACVVGSVDDERVRVAQPTGNIERASATTSDNDMVQLAGLRVNETATYNSDGSLKEVNSIELTAGWGVNRMFVDVAAISYAGLDWVMVVALQQSMLLEKIQHLQVRHRACGVVCARLY